MLKPLPAKVVMQNCTELEQPEAPSVNLERTNSQVTGFKARVVLISISLLKSTVVQIVGAYRGAEFTSLKRALILIKRGHAKWDVPYQAIAFRDPLAFVQGKKPHFDARIAGAYQPYFGDSLGYACLQMEHGLAEYDRKGRRR